MASKNQPNLIVSAAGWLMQFATLLIKGLMARGWDNDRIHALVTDHGVGEMNRIIEAMLEALAPRGTFPQMTLEDFKRGDFRLLVDLDKPLEEVVAAGRLKVDMDHLDKNTFPILGGGLVEVTARLYSINDSQPSRVVLCEIDRAGYRPATFAELLAFAVLSKEVSLDGMMVVALGSITMTGAAMVQSVPLLFDNGRGIGRSCYLKTGHFDDGKWSGDCRFLVIRKSA